MRYKRSEQNVPPKGDACLISRGMEDRALTTASICGKGVGERTVAHRLREMEQTNGGAEVRICKNINRKQTK